MAPMSQVKVERSISVNSNMSWHVLITGKLVAIPTNKILKEFSCHISEVTLQSVQKQKIALREKVKRLEKKKA